MKIRAIITLISLVVSISALADTCPPVDSFNPRIPPAGWSLLFPPIVDGQTYYFGKAVHSLNGSFYYKQVICVYESCPSWGCPAFEILSENTFEMPIDKTPPWNARPSLADTLVCAPSNHDTAVCEFKN